MHQSDGNPRLKAHLKSDIVSDLLSRHALRNTYEGFPSVGVARKTPSLSFTNPERVDSSPPGPVQTADLLPSPQTAAGETRDQVGHRKAEQQFSHHAKSYSTGPFKSRENKKRECREGKMAGFFFSSLFNEKTKRLTAFPLQITFEWI